MGHAPPGIWGGGGIGGVGVEENYEEENLGHKGKVEDMGGGGQG